MDDYGREHCPGTFCHRGDLQVGDAAQGLQYLVVRSPVLECRLLSNLLSPTSHATQVFGKPLIEQAVIREKHGDYR